ncbi:MAG: AAA family ATPase [Candidatus Cryptobacteroides sp.]
MKRIILQSMSLVNFKGIRSLEIDFNPTQTFVCGENGTGKTTLFDAFFWCLFGKDSQNRSDSNFNIKTLDEKGQPILKLEHSVTCVLGVDGETVKLQRRYCEVWTKPRGTTEETLTNHKTEFLINDVKQGTKKDYDAAIGDIIPEDVFRMVTNPYFFTSLKPDVQKDMLLDMAGTIADSEVSALNPEFARLLETLNGKPLSVFLREVASRKRAIKDELAVIPAKIETADRLRPESEDWSALEAELKEKKARIAELDAQISDRSRLSEAEYQRKLGIQQKIGECKMALSRRQSDIRREAESGISEARQELNELSHTISEQSSEADLLAREITREEDQLISLNSRISAKRQQYYDESARKLTFPDGAFVCPTCKRPLEPEDAEAKQKELEGNFNEAKANNLKMIQADGKKLKQMYDDTSEVLNERKCALRSLRDYISNLQAEYEEKSRNVPVAPDTDYLISRDAECIRLSNEITELGNQLTQEAKPVDLSDLKEAKLALGANVDELMRRLAKKDQIDRADKEIRKLEEQRVAANRELTDLEGAEFTATEFQKSKDQLLLDKINGLFRLVSFSFVDAQLNGGEKITCVCTVNGVPYPDVNAAGKLNAGLDIINAICQTKGISAPIFIDNREGVNELIDTVSQVVNLVVSRDQSLTIK